MKVYWLLPSIAAGGLLMGSFQPLSLLQTEKELPPIALAIGEDISSSFQRNYSLTAEYVHSLCRAVEQSERGGIVKLYTVGDPTPSGFITCEIEKFPPRVKEPSPNLSSSLKERAQLRQEYRKKLEEYQRERKRIEGENQRRIDAFVRAADAMLKKRNSRYTDLNGFFEKAAIFLKSDRVRYYEKWLYCNTDGVHDLGSNRSNKLRCDLLPQGVTIYFTGCKPNFACLDGNNRKLLSDPGDFVSLFQEKVKPPASK